MVELPGHSPRLRAGTEASTLASCRNVKRGCGNIPVAVHCLGQPLASRSVVAREWRRDEWLPAGATRLGERPPPFAFSAPVIPSPLPAGRAGRRLVRKSPEAPRERRVCGGLKEDPSRPCPRQRDNGTGAPDSRSLARLSVYGLPCPPVGTMTARQPSLPAVNNYPTYIQHFLGRPSICSLVHWQRRCTSRPPRLSIQCPFTQSAADIPHVRSFGGGQTGKRTVDSEASGGEADQEPPLVTTHAWTLRSRLFGLPESVVLVWPYSGGSRLFCLAVADPVPPADRRSPGRQTASASEV